MSSPFTGKNVPEKMQVCSNERSSWLASENAKQKGMSGTFGRRYLGAGDSNQISPSTLFPLIRSEIQEHPAIFEDSWTQVRLEKDFHFQES